MPWLRQGVLGAATVPASCSSYDGGLTAERHWTIKAEEPPIRLDGNVAQRLGPWASIMRLT